MKIPVSNSIRDITCQELAMRNISTNLLTLKHLLRSEICAREICEKFIYKHSKTIEYVKN